MGTCCLHLFNHFTDIHVFVNVSVGEWCLELLGSTAACSDVVLAAFPWHHAVTNRKETVLFHSLCPDNQYPRRNNISPARSRNKFALNRHVLLLHLLALPEQRSIFFLPRCTSCFPPFPLPSMSFPVPARCSVTPKLVSLTCSLEDRHWKHMNRAQGSFAWPSQGLGKKVQESRSKISSLS